MPNALPHLCALRLADVQAEFEALGLPQTKARYHAKHLYHWLYQRKVESYEAMSDLPKALRLQLQERFDLSPLELTTKQVSNDGTQKFLFKLHDGETIESVLIPTNDRLTICISSQVGCAMGCKFCLTAKQGLKRNLRVDEIVRQVFELSKISDVKITNIVFMGMGEPLHNLENVARAIEILLCQEGLNFSKRKITVSTSGLVPAIRKFNERLDGDNRVNLAISLNASNDEQRSAVMPVNNAFPIAQLLDACREFELEPHRQITFEYVMMGGINDTVEDAKRVMLLLKDLPAKVNIIPFNSNPDSPYQRPTDEAVDHFRDFLMGHGVAAMVRHSRGRDILAACGQLRSSQEQASANVN